MLGTIAEMDAMIGATLEFARDESAGEPRRPTDLVALLHSVVDDMRDAGLPVCMKTAQPVIQECQPAALKRAVRNLLDNAVKYGKSGTVQVRRTPKAVQIVIDDKGPGIPEPELARVLEPFYRLDESRSRESGGVGLGLAIARSILQAHGGSLVLSNRPDGGLRVRLSLPV
jgi:signal transduction histidine kinase